MNQLNRDDKHVKDLLKIKKEDLLEELINTKKSLELLQMENDLLKGTFDLFQDCVEQEAGNDKVRELYNEFKDKVEALDMIYDKFVNNPEFYSN